MLGPTVCRSLVVLGLVWLGAAFLLSCGKSKSPTNPLSAPTASVEEGTQATNRPSVSGQTTSNGIATPFADGEKMLRVIYVQWVKSIHWKEPSYRLDTMAKPGFSYFLAHIEFLPAARELMKGEVPTALTLAPLHEGFIEAGLKGSPVEVGSRDMRCIVTSAELTFLSHDQKKLPVLALPENLAEASLMSTQRADGTPGDLYFKLDKIRAYAEVPADKSLSPTGIVWAGKYWVPVPPAEAE